MTHRATIHLIVDARRGITAGDLAQSPPKFHIRLATPADARACLEIYAPIVTHTTTSFELEPPSESQMCERIVQTIERYPWLVCESDVHATRAAMDLSSQAPPVRRGEILGYAYATSFRPRPAYQWNVETTVYIREDVRGKGIGRALYEALFHCLRLQGFGTALAAIALLNPASVTLHERLGFKPVGVFHAGGFKLGRWVDVGWWEMKIQELSIAPATPRRPAELVNDMMWLALTSSPLDQDAQ